jgi:hypothetical protein
LGLLSFEGLAMRANTITAEIEVPQVGAETQRPVGLTLNSRDNLSAKFQREPSESPFARPMFAHSRGSAKAIGFSPA